jgi:hypothetical protein
MDEVDGPADRRREADAVVGPEHVVVHRLRDRHDRNALGVEPKGERERVVAADRKERREPELAHHLQDVAGVIPRPLIVPPVAEERRFVGRHHPRGVRARRVQERPAGPVDRPHDARIERDRVDLDGERVGRVDRQEPAPAAPDPDDLMPLRGGMVDGGLDARVQTRNVAAAGEDADLHGDRVRPTGARAVGPAAILGPCSAS